jgi:hypothetical protein
MKTSNVKRKIRLSSHVLTFHVQSPIYRSQDPHNPLQPALARGLHRLACPAEPGSKAIYITIEHAKGRGDQNCIMDLFIGSTKFLRVFYLIWRNILSTFLYAGGNGQ